MVAADILAYIIAIAVPIGAGYLIFALDLFGTGKAATVLFCWLWGATGAIVLAYAVNQAAQEAVSFFTVVTVVAPITEEIWKALILLYFVQLPRFRYFVDGAVYGFAAGIGFAVSENIFYILSDSDGEVLPLIVKRVLSSSLMHGFASAILGLSLGLMRRTAGWQKVMVGLAGWAGAIGIHWAYNNIIQRLEGTDLLLVAFGIGLGGSLIIGGLISWGLAAEKRRFAETLGLNVGVSGAERRAVQQLGGQTIETILHDLAIFFGEDKTKLIRELLLIQANIGILRNNLKEGVSSRLRSAWESEIADYRNQADRIRRELGLYVMLLLRSLLPEDDETTWNTFSLKLTEYHPTKIHAFDLFLSASKKTDTLSPQQIDAICTMLARNKIFMHLQVTDLENLSRAISKRVYERGQALFNRGDEGDALYLVEQGYVEIYTQDHYGKKTVLRTAGPNEIFGELALIDGGQRSAWARATVPTKTWVLHRAHFMMFTQSRPTVILALLQFLADNVRESNELMIKDLRDTNEVIFARIQEALRESGSFSDLEVQHRASHISRQIRLSELI